MQNREKPRDSMYGDSALSVRWDQHRAGCVAREREREREREGRGRKARESNVAVRMRRGLTLAPARRRSKYKETNPVSVGVQRERKEMIVRRAAALERASKNRARAKRRDEKYLGSTTRARGSRFRGTRHAGR